VEPDQTQLAFLQAKIDEMGGQFRQWVQGNRAKIDPEVFRAGWYSGKQAESLGLVNAISNYTDAISKIRASLDNN
jgi:ClpP class serine protease